MIVTGVRCVVYVVTIRVVVSGDSVAGVPIEKVKGKEIYSYSMFKRMKKH